MPSDNDENKRLLSELLDEKLTIHVGGMESKLEEVDSTIEAKTTSLKQNIDEIAQLVRETAAEKAQGNLPKDVYSLLYFTVPIGFEQLGAEELRQSEDEVNCSHLQFGCEIVAFVLAVFLFQVAMLSFVMLNLLDYDSSNLPIFNPPGDVTSVVRMSQYFAIPIAVWSQEDIIESADVFLFKKDTCKKYWLYLSGALKFAVGLLGLLVSIIIVVQSNRVIDLFANFAAMVFISQIDNVLYTLVLNGHSFHFLRNRAEQLSKLNIEKDPGTSTPRIRLTAKIIGFSLMVAILLGPLIYVHVNQHMGNYLPRTIDVYMGEDTGDVQAIYRSGEYKIINTKRTDGRFMYYQNDCVTGCKRMEEENMSDLETCIEKCAYVKYNGRSKKWVFGFADHLFKDGELAQSERTDVFDIADVTNWQFWHWSEIHAKTIALATSSFSVKSNKCYQKDDCGAEPNSICSKAYTCECNQGYLGPKCQGARPCAELVVDIGRSFPDYDQSFMILEDGDEPFLFKGRPVYYSEDSGKENFNFMFFIGNRWVLANRYNLFGKNGAEIGDLQEKFMHNKFDLYYDNFKADYASQESLSYSPAGLSWNRWDNHYFGNEKQEDGLIGQLEPVDSLLFCRVCSRGTGGDNCNAGFCSKDMWEGMCDCNVGWFGSKCNTPTMISREVQLTFDYEDSTMCLQSPLFNPLPLSGNEFFTYDLIAPIPFENEKSVGIFISKNATLLTIYESSCELRERKLLKTVTLYNDENNFMDLILQEHDDLFEINATGVYIIDQKNDYCEDETFSTPIPQYIRHRQNFVNSTSTCNVWEFGVDELLLKVERILVSWQFAVISKF